MENIDIDIDKDNLKNIDIDIDIDMAILENIDIDKGILKNIDIDKISYRLGFGISNTPSEKQNFNRKWMETGEHLKKMRIGKENLQKMWG